MKIDIHEIFFTKEKLESSLRDAISIRNQMEGKMQSRYDTQREEWARQCEIIESQIASLLGLLDFIYTNQSNEQIKRVCLGSLVELTIDNDEREIFLITEANGGIGFSNITTLSISSPLGKKIIGCEKNEIINYKNNDEIVKIRVENVESYSIKG